MGISDDLKQRLRNIELEQKRQELALKKLDDFEQKIKDLEAQLQQIDGFEIKLQQEVNYGQLRNLDETQRIEAELRRMDKEYHARDFNELRYFEEIAQLREKLSGEINSLKDRRDRLLDRQMGTFQEEPKTTTPGVDQSPSPKKVAQPLMNTENSMKPKNLQFN